MPAVFSEEVGGKAGGRGGGVQAAMVSSTTGRKSKEQEPTFLWGHHAAQTAERERQQSVQTDSSLLLSTRGGVRMQYSTALRQCSTDRYLSIPLLLPPLVSPSIGEVSPI